jgi:hypothetical protein
MSDQTSSQPGRASSAPDSSEVGRTLFDDVIRRFIEPEIQRRTESGTWGEDLGLFMFQLLLPDDREPEIRLNEEIGGTLTATAARPLMAGEPVAPRDMSGISAYTPRPEDADVPHVTAIAHAGGWSLTFEFAGGHPRRGEFLQLGRDYLQTARDALAASRLGPYIDTAFSAAELFAKAELLSCRPTVELALNSKTHGAVSGPYHQWANLGNTDVRFARMLSRLLTLRGAGRYLRAPLSLSAGLL